MEILSLLVEVWSGGKGPIRTYIGRRKERPPVGGYQYCGANPRPIKVGFMGPTTLLLYVHDTTPEYSSDCLAPQVGADQATPLCRKFKFHLKTA